MVTVQINVDESTVGELKAAISQVTGIGVEEQVLVFAGRRLNDTQQRLADLRIMHSTTIHLVRRKP